MGSAPVSRSFEGRLGSSARRGAYVGQGMPGVYRVTRPRSTPAQSLPRARANPNPWITPPDQNTAVFSSGRWVTNLRTATVTPPTLTGTSEEAAQVTMYGAPGSFGLGTSGSSAAVIGAVDIGSSGVNFVGEVVQFSPTFDLGSIIASTYAPPFFDWPPGATGVEPEASTSEILTARYTGDWKMLQPTNNDPGGHGLHSGAVMAAFGGLDALDGSNHPVWMTGADILAASIATLGDLADPSAVDGPLESYNIDVVSVLDASGYIVVTTTLDMITAELPLYQQQGIQMRVTNASASASMGLLVTYRPPRYRFTF